MSTRRAFPAPRRAFAAVVLTAVPLAGLTGCSTIAKVKNTANALKDVNKDTEKLDQAIAKAATLTFRATYDQTDSEGKVTSVVVSQKPPKSSYVTPTASFIDDGTNLISCQLPDKDSTDKPTCTTLGPHVEGGVYGTGFAATGFAPLAFLPSLKLSAALAGFTTSATSEKLAGQDTDCTAIDKSGADGGHYKFCTTTDGVLALSETGKDGKLDSRLVLTKYETSVNDDAFTPPVKSKTIEELTNDATSTTSTTEEPSTTSTTDEPTTTSTTDGSSDSSTTSTTSG